MPEENTQPQENGKKKNHYHNHKKKHFHKNPEDRRNNEQNVMTGETEENEVRPERKPNGKKHSKNNRPRDRRAEYREEEDIYGDPEKMKEMAEWRRKIVLNQPEEKTTPVVAPIPKSNDFTAVTRTTAEQIDEESTMDVSHILNREETTGETLEVVGVRFRNTGKMYYFDPQGAKIKKGDNLIVETARGTEYGSAVTANKWIPKKEAILPLRPVLRIATRDDDLRHESNVEKEKEALILCRGRIEAHDLPMQLFDARYAFDNSILLFYFTADNRVDFRDLVKDLSSLFHTRIELRQIGSKDEAKLLGGIGNCGRVLCCTSHLGGFLNTNVKMAKEQGLAFSSKLNGFCGRPMCCLQYELEFYREAGKDFPDLGNTVITPEGEGKVTSVNLLDGTVRVMIPNEDTQKFITVPVSDVKQKNN